MKRPRGRGGKRFSARAGGDAQGGQARGKGGKGGKGRGAKRGRRGDAAAAAAAPGAAAGAPAAAALEAEGDAAPRSLVVRRGKVGKLARELVADLRLVMSPNTATKLKERNTNTIKDYVSVAPSLGVSHLLTVSQSKKTGYVNLGVARVPRGPTLSFRVVEYALMSRLRKVQRKPVTPTPGMFDSAPLVVLNNFQVSDAPRWLNVVGQTFQAMFPALDVSTVRLSECRRVLLLHYDSQEQLFELRQYFVRADPQGASRPVRKILHAVVPDLSHVADVADVIERGAGLGGGETSDSEAEDPSAAVLLPGDFGRQALGNRKGKVSVVKLRELGPRLRLQLVKVQDEVFGGEVTFHLHRTLTAEELEAQRSAVQQRRELAEERRKEQEANVERKRQLEEERAERKRERLEHRRARLDSERAEAIKRMREEGGEPQAGRGEGFDGAGEEGGEEDDLEPEEERESP